MVESTLQLDRIFGSLSSPIRRDMLKRVAKKKELSVSDVAKPYRSLTLAAVSKHLMVLKKAQLIQKRRKGKEQMVRLSPAAFKNATEYLRHYEKLWNDRFDRLEEYLRQQ